MTKSNPVKGEKVVKRDKELLAIEKTVLLIEELCADFSGYELKRIKMYIASRYAILLKEIL